MAKKVIKHIWAVRNGITRKFNPLTWNTMDSGDGEKYGWKETSTHEAEVPKAVKENIAKMPKPVKEGRGPVVMPPIQTNLGDVNED